MQNRTYLKIAIFITLISISLLLYRITSKPISYLHSWNQITTLVTIKAIGEGKINIFSPKDIVTRVSYGIEPLTPFKWEKDDRFNTFEEFPLYHWISSILGNILGSYELGSHLTSMVFFFLLIHFLIRLLSSYLDKSQIYILYILLITSPALLYYGQAIMSDVAMTSCIIISLYCFNQWYSNTDNSRSRVIIGLFFFIIATIFKSYAIIFSPVLIYILIKKSKNISIKINILNCILVIMACFPVLYWHYWSNSQPGYHDSNSHNIYNKLNVLLQIEYYYSVYKHLLKFLGIIPFYLALFGSLLFLITHKKQRLSNNKPVWFIPYTICFGFFLIATADKIQHHEYYLLLGVPIFFYLCAIYINNFLIIMKIKPTISILFIVLHIGLITKSYLKATNENPDVLQCANLVRKSTEENTQIGILTDVTRFNSINFYADRPGVVIEEKSFGIEVYRKHGVKYVVSSLNNERESFFNDWFLRQSDNLKLLKKEIYKDAKKRDMICSIYEVI